MRDIELVIKIPENTYRQIQALARNGYFEHDICGNSMRRIANGTPLPKGHGDLIDKREFKRWIETQDGDKLMTEYYLDALDMQETGVGGLYDGDID